MKKNGECWLVAVAAGRFQLESIQIAQRNGIQVAALDGDPRAPGLKIADKNAVVDIKDPIAVLHTVQDLGISPQGAISFVSDIGIPAAALLREYYRLPGPSVEKSLALTNKVIQRRIWQSHNVPCPQWLEIHSFKEAQDGIKIIGYPAIIKPADSCGSRGVYKIEADTPLEKLLRETMAFSQTNTTIIESFVEGQEYSIDTFSENGRTHVLSICERTLIHNKTASKIFTADLTDDRQKIIAKTTQHALEALGYTDGPAHTELILTPEDLPKLVETSGRGGGFHIFDRMIPKVSDYDIVTATILQAVGRKVLPIPKKTQKKYAILHYIPSYPGLVQEIKGFKLANKLDGVEAEPLVSVGDKVQKVQCDLDRLGYILTVADTFSKSHLLTMQALELIDFKVETL